jgi:tetratricopeptide (TPR) repeat protein
VLSRYSRARAAIYAAAHGAASHKGAVQSAEKEGSSIKLLGSLLGLVLLSYGAVEVWLGNMSYDSPVKKRYCAAWLCPEEFWDTRTFTMLQQSGAGDATALLPEFQRALRSDPGSAYAWANLAEVERDAQQFTQAKYCFQRAVAAGPGNPAILFRAANFAFQTGDNAEIMRDLSTVLRNPDLTNYYQPVFLTYSRLDIPIEEMLDKGVPVVSTAAEPLLQFWIDEKKVPEATATWNWMMQHSLTTEKSCGSYVSFLVANNQIDKAAEEWRRANPKTTAHYQVLNWVFNGGFEMEPEPGPFDWHIESTPDVEATRVQDVSRDGQWSVKLTFGGQTNVDYHGVYQDTVVKPGQWKLRGFLKLDGITTDQGISIRVYDLAQPSRLDARTDARTGSSFWNEVERAFVVGPETKLVRVEIMRDQSRKIDSKIAGGVWVDSIDLSPIR